jgi:hypothetical protein
MRIIWPISALLFLCAFVALCDQKEKVERAQRHKAKKEGREVFISILHRSKMIARRAATEVQGVCSALFVISHNLRF